MIPYWTQVKHVKTFFTWMSYAGKRQVFRNILVFKKNHVKIKNAWCIYMFSCDIIEIPNC